MRNNKSALVRISGIFFPAVYTIVLAAAISFAITRLQSGETVSALMFGVVAVLALRLLWNSIRRWNSKTPK